MEISIEQGIDRLTRWQDDGTMLWACFAASEGAVGCEMRAQIVQVSKCLILKNESTTLRFDLLKAHFKFGPLQVLLTPSTLGRAGVVTHAKEGFAGNDGLHVRWESGHLLFLCEDGGQKRFTLSADALDQIPVHAYTPR
jgi:hypothetical protein